MKSGCICICGGGEEGVAENPEHADVGVSEGMMLPAVVSAYVGGVEIPSMQVWWGGTLSFPATCVGTGGEEGGGKIQSVQMGRGQSLGSYHEGKGGAVARSMVTGFPSNGPGVSFASTPFSLPPPSKGEGGGEARQRRSEVNSPSPN